MVPLPLPFAARSEPPNAASSPEVAHWATLEAKSDTTRDDLLREATAPQPTPNVSRAFTISLLFKTALYMSRVLFTDR
jgi:hypothetical protein